jgi:hypothetical protein
LSFIFSTSILRKENYTLTVYTQIHTNSERRKAIKGINQKKEQIEKRQRINEDTSGKLGHVQTVAVDSFSREKQGVMEGRGRPIQQNELLKYFGNVSN